MSKRRIEELYDGGEDGDQGEGKGYEECDSQGEPLTPELSPAEPPAASRTFTREDFEELRNDDDLSPSTAAGQEEDPDYISIRTPGKSYFVIHPDDELIVPTTVDVRRSSKEPYIVMRPCWHY